jgi:hypothetical protein
MPKFLIVPTPLLTTLYLQTHTAQPDQLQILYKMAKTRKTNRRNCQQPDPLILLTVLSPREALTIIDTSRQARFIYDV